jgi:hypothetical protein
VLVTGEKFESLLLTKMRENTEMQAGQNNLSSDVEVVVENVLVVAGHDTAHAVS